jgi:DNA sulfur modification protein DndD
LEAEVQAKEAERAAYYAFLSKGESTNLEARLEELKSKIEEGREKLIFQHTADLPLVANQELVHRCIVELEAGENQRVSAQVSLLDYLIKLLPLRVFNEAPDSEHWLMDSNRIHYQQKIKYILNEERDNRKEREGLFTLSSQEVSKLVTELNIFERDRERQLSRKQNFDTLANHLSELIRLEDKLSDANEFEQSQRQAYLRLNEELEKSRAQLAVTREDLKRLKFKTRKQERSRERKELLEDQGRLYKEKAINKQARLKYDLARDLLNLCEVYRKHLKMISQESLEKAVREKWRLLAPSYNVIHEIQIDRDTFTWQFFDSVGSPVGRSSISAGMKQLFATSLLWALKDVSGKKIPPVIDTPLGRLDETNRKALLTRYYPNVGEQVIILPTDSEINPENYSALKQYIYREFRLVNETKVATTVEPNTPMHASKRGRRPKTSST